MPNVTVALMQNMVAQLGMADVKGYAVYFESSGSNPTWTALNSSTWTPVAGGGATVTLSPGDQKGLKIYFILQSTDVPGNSVQTQITTESQIVPTGPTTSAQALNYRYDSFEVTFTPSSGIFAYILTQGSGMAERNRSHARMARDEIRQIAGFSAADEIEKLDRLKSQKSISDDEYTRLRARLVQ